jgi:hypothetical protein
MIDVDARQNKFGDEQCRRRNILFVESHNNKNDENKRKEIELGGQGAIQGSLQNRGLCNARAL